jgi:hypothetical protein
MTRKNTKLASREWSGSRPTPEAVQTPPYGFRVPQQNASVHADPWSSGECRLKAPEFLREGSWFSTPKA